MNPNAAGMNHGDPNMMGMMGGQHHPGQMGGGGPGGPMHGPPPGSGGAGPQQHNQGQQQHPHNMGGHPGQHPGQHQGLPHGGGQGVRQQIGQAGPGNGGPGGPGGGRCCAGCGAKIMDRFLLEALDRYWHNACLKCSCCHVTLADIGSSCFTKGGMILCKNDYIRIFGNSGACSACGQMIPASEFVMRAQTNVYHLKCFACVKCHHQLVAGDRYNLVNGSVLCEQDCLKILKGGGGGGGGGGVGAGGPGLHGGPGSGPGGNAGTGVRKNAKMRVNNAIKV